MLEAGCGGVTVECLNPGSHSDWDRMIAPLPDATFFHTAAWAAVLQRAYGYVPRYLAIRRGQDLAGVLPFMEVDSWVTGRRGVSLPFTDFCRTLAVSQEARQRLHQTAVQLGKERRWRYWETRGGELAVGGSSSARTFLAHRLALTGGEDRLFSALNGSVRRGIRKAEQQGVTVTRSDREADLRAFYHLLCLTRRRHGVPPQPWSFFEAIQREVIAPGQGAVFLARVDGRVAAGAVFFRFRGKIIFKYGASDYAFQALRPNHLVMWEAIRDNVRTGAEELDFGRTDEDNPGLRAFKLSWGASERRIEYVRADASNRQICAAPGRRFPWVGSVIRRLPLPLLQPLGVLLYRHVA